MGEIADFKTKGLIGNEKCIIKKLIKVIGVTGQEATIVDCFVSKFGIEAFFNTFESLGFTNKTNTAIANLKRVAKREEEKT